MEGIDDQYRLVKSGKYAAFILGLGFGSIADEFQKDATNSTGDLTEALTRLVADVRDISNVLKEGGTSIGNETDSLHAGLDIASDRCRTWGRPVVVPDHP
ncbi:MAG: hypothetical protein QOG53_3621 [Frankiales bacterium]|jgi:hypothetical protein|nr:hypothetical protein [Frankiales bacterium]